MPVNLKHVDIPVVSFCYGESKSCSIAAASIIAKVTRDRLMSRLDPVVPGYSFASNKGYGTAVHRKGIDDDGLSFMHRLTFINDKSDEEMQASILADLDESGFKNKKSKKKSKVKKKVKKTKKAAKSSASAKKSGPKKKAHQETEQAAQEFVT